jgi:type I restriction-modification system DNA methylase subunit
MTIGEDFARRINVLDPCVGTGRLLMSAYKVNPNSNLFGVDIDLDALRIAHVNFLVHDVKNFYLLHADSLRHEIDFSKPEGNHNWQFANRWNSCMSKLKPIGIYEEEKRQLELALD